ncbi:MAG TPA: GH3 auxin-responsive promoter family protein, partial [Puia sp.]|nr:GH3 auxin-responsive promoter family protein [Puia sp.]
IQTVSEDLNLSIPEFTVAGVPHGLFFAHQWWLSCNDPADANVLRGKIDDKLKELNDDYAVERKSALKDIYVQVLPEQKFMDFMRLRGKIGGQHKFPRVLKGKILQDWQKFLETGSI